MQNELKWLENSVIYEIYPQSFYDTNGDGIGDIRGILEKLDYVKPQDGREEGVRIIYSRMRHKKNKKKHI